LIALRNGMRGVGFFNLKALDCVKVVSLDLAGSAG
jgi:hypothetical protein